MLVRCFGDEKVIYVSPKDAYHLLDHYLCMSEAVVHFYFLQPLALKMFSLGLDQHSHP